MFKAPLRRKAAPSAIWHEGDISYRRPDTRNLCCGYSWCQCFPRNSPFVACLGNGMCPRHWRKARKGPFIGSIFKATFAKQIQHKQNLAQTMLTNPHLCCPWRASPCWGTLAGLCECPAACKDALPILKLWELPAR